MFNLRKNWFLWLLVLGFVGMTGYYTWQDLTKEELPEAFASGNGRLEAVEIDVATERSGKLETITVREGEMVEKRQVLARMDTDVLQAQLRESEAQRRRATVQIETARSRVDQRQAEKRAAEARLAQRQAELNLAEKSLARVKNLSEREMTSEQSLDEAVARVEQARGAVEAARAEVAAAEAALGNARSDVIDAEASLEAVEATLDRIRAEIDNSILKAPISGRVQYRVAEPGEVLSPGGTVVNLVDLSDVYMTFFLSTRDAGRLGIGSEARIVLDAAPQFVVPAQISFVSDVAQFTPKTVETREEREKMMFRVKAQVDPALLKKYLTRVKTGLPGVAYVRVDPNVEWPDRLKPNLPE